MEAVGVGDDQEQRCGKLSNGFDRVVPDPVIDTQLREPVPRGQFEMQLAQRFMPLLLGIKGFVGIKERLVPQGSV